MFTPEDDAAILRAGWDDRTLADMLFMPIDMMRQRRLELTGPEFDTQSGWTKEQDDWLMQSHANSMTYAHIALKMGRSKNSVISRSCRLRGAKW